MDQEQIDLKKYIRDIPDWPKEGILFRDITPLLANPKALSAAIKALAKDFENSGIEYVAAVEARGFVFGPAVAEALGAGFILIRKRNKLPGQTEAVTYDLEYGQDTLEVHVDALPRGAKVLMVDDLLATGGTMAAACELIEKIGGDVVGISFLVELSDLNGRGKLPGYRLSTVIRY